MIERLDQLSLSDFIDLIAGDNSVLFESGDTVDNDTLNLCASKLMTKYRAIVNPTGTKAMLVEHEDITKERMNILCLRICQTLISLDAYDDVRDILLQMGIDASSLIDDQVKSKVDELLRTALFEQKRNENMRANEDAGADKPTPDQIRSSFDAEIAFMMTYFKMPIDIRTTSAAVYANIVHQADVDIRRKLRSQ